MKITFLTPHVEISGGVKIIFQYAERLAKRGHEVTIVCPRSSLITGRALGLPIIHPSRLIANLINYKPSWIPFRGRIRYVKSFEERHIPESDATVATAWQTAPYVNSYSRNKGEKFYLIQHYESLFHGEKAHVDRTLQYPITKIVVSSWLKEVLQQFGTQSELIINPIDFNVFYPTRGACNNNGIRICMLHHLYEWKGVKDGVEAFELAQKEYPDICLVMFGSKVKRVNIDCEYHFKPTDEELRRIYNSCDIFLCPSWVEGFGLTSAEALACKRSLVSTDNGGNRDYAIHEKTALLSPPKDPCRLAENLVRMIFDRELSNNLAHAGFERVRRFTWDDATDKMEAILSRHI
jgi:glycosyltransferase involved in cell wall biosynthesis